MIALAGAITGLLMSCVFVGHMAILLVFYTPKWLLERAKDENAQGISRAIVWGAALAVPLWAALGVVAALIYDASATGSNAGVSGLPTPLYLGIVLGVIAITGSIALWRMNSIRWHLAFDYVVFAILFLMLLPWLVSVA